MKNLHECLVELAPYNIDFKMKDGKVLLGLEYKEGWQVIKPDNENIECFKYGEKYYYGTIMSDEKCINEIFELIKMTIRYNQELEKKIELFQKKMTELQDIFAKEDYEDLLNLTFHLDKPKKRKKKEVSKVEKTEVKEEIKTEEEIVEPINDELSCVKEKVIDDIKYVNTMEDDNEESDDSSYSVTDLNNFIGIS